jgi:hypothetical protein
MLNALQIALLSEIARNRGGWEATWISMLASLAGMAIILSLLTLSGSSIDLAQPFQSAWL